MNIPALVVVLNLKGIKTLFHANTVQTSCTFLGAGGLASRGYVERNGLPQTPQSSDDTDKAMGVWNDVFLDTDDIHWRSKSPNAYGPVLFQIDVAALNKLPVGSDIRITKKNPLYWGPGEPDSARLFKDVAEVDKDLVKGRFEQMIMVRTPAALLPFPVTPVQIALDNPQRTLSDGSDAFQTASGLLNQAGNAAQRRVALTPHVCRADCKCKETYAAKGDLDGWFK